MADKRRVTRSIKQLQAVKTWQLVIVLILMLFVSATFLRLNNTGMIERKNAVVAADKTGNIEDIQSRIYDLQRYAAAHMNADTGVFYLQEQYNRDVKEQALEASNGGSERALEIRKAADAVCQPLFSGWSPAYVRCYVNELNKHSADEINSAQLQLPSSAQYRYSFVSPLWSPDFAGWSLLVSAAIVLMIVFRLLGLGVLRLLIARHYRQI
ncbi:hypothetical protein EOL96_01050 [Candidatus Saccharibacteria bacterium]|nr:hypothetical protein [Candidatus Saccharibacteria bacterium]